MSDYLHTIRQNHNFLSPEELIATVGEHNDVLDPNSVLIPRGISVGTGNIFYPNVVIQRENDGEITIGDENIFYPGTFMAASLGRITIGNNNEFGIGGCSVRANIPQAAITIGDGGRYSGGADIMGVTALGDGSQILGAITVQSCNLAEGGTFQEPDPDERGAVLKGMGLARGIVLQKGQVVNGLGNFADQPIEWQRDYHPKPNQ